jgi:hypothetical protein
MKITELLVEAPQTIKPLKMGTPPKAPDATIPRTRTGYTTDDGVPYKQDKYNQNIMHVTTGGGTYSFDGARLIKWSSPKVAGYRQIHDLVQKTITLDATTQVGDVGITQGAVYDMQGKLVKGTKSIGIRSGGVATKVSDKDGYNLSYRISDTLEFRVKSNIQKAKNANPNVIKKAVAMMQKPDMYSQLRGFDLLRQIGDVKWLVNGKATNAGAVFRTLKGRANEDQDVKPKIFTTPATPGDTNMFKQQEPLTDKDKLHTPSNPNYQKALKDFNKNLSMLRSTYKMLQDLGQTDPEMEKAINNLIQKGIKSGFVKGA